MTKPPTRPLPPTQAGKEVNFKRLALDLMFGSGFNVTEAGLAYRAGKGVADVHKARQKALKNGLEKTEFELSMLELYLKDVFKAHHVDAVEPATA